MDHPAHWSIPTPSFASQRSVGHGGQGRLSTMSLSDIFRFGRKRVRPVGQQLEKGLDTERTRRRNLALKIGIFVILVLLTVAAFPREDVFEYSVDVGDTWSKETLVADLAFSIRKDKSTYEQELEAVRRDTPPYFRTATNARAAMTAHRDTVASQLSRIFKAYEAYQFNRLRGRMSEALDDSTRYHNLRRSSRLKLTPDQWRVLLNSYAETVPELGASRRQMSSARRVDELVLQYVWEVGAQMLELGVLDVPVDSIDTDIIIVRDRQLDNDTEIDLQNVYGLNEAHVTARQQFMRDYRDSPQLVPLADAFFRAIFEPSLQLDRDATLKAWSDAQRRISPTEGVVEAGSVIVRKGDVVTAETKRILTSFEQARKLRSGEQILWRQLAGQFLVIFGAYLFFFLYLYLLRRPLFDNNAMVLLMALLFAVFVGLFAFAVRAPFVGMYAVPVAIMSVLLTVMFDSRVGLFATFTLALIGALLAQYNFEFFYATLFAGSLAVHSVRDIKNRAQFFVSAGIVFAGYAFILFGTFLLQGITTTRLLDDLLDVALNSFFIVMAYPLLWVFERAFDLSTDLTFLELSDTNRPLLKELSLKAPGTFNHSLQVANLAEAAADTIGANALMTRVGALYHDVGKMQKPEYFVENQRPGENPHDQLKPRMSALIIASHVKEGIEIAREYNLPQAVVDFIPMHHGTSLIEFFYRRAIEQTGGEENDIQQSEFRYPGPKPTSKETGILMLADSVEAASRALANPTHKRLETLIDSLIKSRIEDGQLEHTDLTFTELNVIKDTFLSMLLGMYHVRVKYPDQEKLEEEADQEEAADASPDEVAPAEDLFGAESVRRTVGAPRTNGGPSES